LNLPTNIVSVKFCQDCLAKQKSLQYVMYLKALNGTESYDKNQNLTSKQSLLKSQIIHFIRSRLSVDNRLIQYWLHLHSQVNRELRTSSKNAIDAWMKKASKVTELTHPPVCKQNPKEWSLTYEHTITSTLIDCLLQSFCKCERKEKWKKVQINDISWTS